MNKMYSIQELRHLIELQLEQIDIYEVKQFECRAPAKGRHLQRLCEIGDILCQTALQQIEVCIAQCEQELSDIDEAFTALEQDEAVQEKNMVCERNARHMTARSIVRKHHAKFVEIGVLL